MGRMMLMLPRFPSSVAKSCGKPNVALVTVTKIARCMGSKSCDGSLAACISVAANVPAHADSMANADGGQLNGALVDDVDADDAVDDVMDSVATQMTEQLWEQVHVLRCSGMPPSGVPPGWEQVAMKRTWKVFPHKADEPSDPTEFRDEEQFPILRSIPHSEACFL